MWRDPRHVPGGVRWNITGMGRHFFPAVTTTGRIKRDLSGPGSVNPIVRRQWPERGTAPAGVESITLEHVWGQNGVPNGALRNSRGTVK